MTGLVLTLVAATALLGVMLASLADATRQSASIGGTARDDAALADLLASGVESRP